MPKPAVLRAEGACAECIRVQSPKNLLTEAACESDGSVSPRGSCRQPDVREPGVSQYLLEDRQIQKESHKCFIRIL